MAEESGRARLAAGMIAMIAWGAITAQLALNFGNAPGEGKPLWIVPFQLYGYFTIWSNTLVALVTTHFAMRRDGKALFGRPGTLAATMVYIIVVGAIYNTLLAGFRHLDGTPKFIDMLLHVIVPLAYPAWWLTCIRRGQLAWRLVVPAMAFPLAYWLVAMGRGLLTGKYAYFFIDVGKYGLPQVLINIGGLVVLFAGLMAMVIGFDRWMVRTNAPAAVG
jgi:hypothetical protein